ncbi:MAG: hypothetical protein IJ449_03340 [Clostridia bacterium]|nr:hypothetical protein [Clostridia bacterium]
MKPPSGECKDHNNNNKAAPPCRDAARWEPFLYEYAERTADDGIRAEIEAHLAECPFCRAQTADIQEMLSALHMTAPRVPETLHSDIMRAVRAEQDGALSADRAGHIESRLVGRRHADGDDTPLTVMVRAQSKKNRFAKFSQTAGGIAAVLLLVMGMAYLLPVLSRVGRGGSTSASHDVLTDMETSGTEALFVVGNVAGEGGDSGAAEAKMPAETGNVLGAVSNAFSDRTEAAKETAAEPDITYDVQITLTEEDADNATDAASVSYTPEYYAYIYVAEDCWDELVLILSDPAQLAQYAGVTEDEARAVTDTLTETEDGLILTPGDVWEWFESVLPNADLVGDASVVVDGTYTKGELVDAVCVTVDPDLG